MRYGIQAAELKLKLRAAGVQYVTDVKRAVLEQNGQLNVVQFSEDNIRFDLIDDGQINQFTLDVIEKDRDWLEQEIQNPISINEIARLVGNDTALASNVYLAARLVSKDLSRKEIIFLADLAQALGLDDALVEQLEKQAGF